MSSSAESSADHNALANQLLNSFGDNPPLNKLDRCSRKDTAKSRSMFPDPPIPTTPDDIRERLERGGFIARAMRDGFFACWRSLSECTYEDQPTGTWSAMVSLFDLDGIRRMTLHGLFLSGGGLGASGKLDPKFLLDDDGIAYNTV